MVIFVNFKDGYLLKINRIDEEICKLANPKGIPNHVMVSYGIRLPLLRPTSPLFCLVDALL